ncbi:tRNA isopentenyl-2-thiomethyl-A-37 hydroxylase MiaE [Gayadomonas joobiniege]|uniref:tRNA isopentenyl-2-thiomethyl-A-37 hydroxylase MiaE n=1 Tax=Gayadomonas joobiniege TaxID=1234606 RepID=UPI00036F43C4|nr:tRNA isopentenyl-2-thiomethyl-A-37 hydroxylase MiaE [Gayadomonas joobiniege]
MQITALLEPINSFLLCPTPTAWINEAKKPENLSLLLTDHMICELKAAQTAMWLIRKYAVDQTSGDILLAWLKPYEDFVYRKQGNLTSLADKNRLTKNIKVAQNTPYSQDLVDKMVLLIKEELHHFYQVLEIMQAREIHYDNITAGRYAKGMIRHVKTHEPETLTDKLIVGAYIEARSCERFAALAPFLDSELNKFYVSLLRSEARHYQDYLTLAQQIANDPLSERIKYFASVEAELICTPDRVFRFHSGVPETATQ